MGFIIDILKLNNGIILTFLTKFKIGLLKDNQGFGTYYSLMLAIHKLETSFSIAWRTTAHGEEKKNKSKSKTTVASA